MTGSELRRARTLANKTQTQIAEETGLDKAVVCKYEKGLRDGTLAKIEKLLGAYGFRIIGPDSEWNEFEEAE